jgi:hypothetical protein
MKQNNCSKVAKGRKPNAKPKLKQSDETKQLFQSCRGSKPNAMDEDQQKAINCGYIHPAEA